MNELLTIINPREERIMREGRRGLISENDITIERVQKLIARKD